ncbi:MAG: hypothetical protein EXQ86_01645 [Rhodospirillales bacterium]|nr:hypothetical protein [Rhodospirillales bacterium]
MKTPRSGTRLAAVAAVVVSAAACAVDVPPTVPPLDADTPHSIVLANGERVCNLAGEWDANVDGHADIFQITQDQREFTGRSLKGTIYFGRGSKVIEGKLAGAGLYGVIAMTIHGWLQIPIPKLTDKCTRLDLRRSTHSIVLTRR